MWHLAAILVTALALVLPTAVFALDGSPRRSVTAQIVYQHEGGEEAADDGTTEGGGTESGGAGFVLTLIIGIIALIIAVVAVIGAVGLGVIGIGYASVSNSEE